MSAAEEDRLAVDKVAWLDGPYPADAWEPEQAPLVTTLGELAEVWDATVEAGRAPPLLQGWKPDRGLDGAVTRKGRAPVKVYLQYEEAGETHELRGRLRGLTVDEADELEGIRIRCGRKYPVMQGTWVAVLPGETVEDFGSDGEHTGELYGGEHGAVEPLGGEDQQHTLAAQLPADATARAVIGASESTDAFVSYKMAFQRVPLGAGSAPVDTTVDAAPSAPATANANQDTHLRAEVPSETAPASNAGATATPAPFEPVPLEGTEEAAPAAPAAAPRKKKKKKPTKAKATPPGKAAKQYARVYLLGLMEATGEFLKRVCAGRHD
jgi:hypothetical protein